MERLIALAVVLLVTAAFAAWWRARDGRVTAVPSAGPAEQADRAAAADVVAAINPATPLVLVEFTAPNCVPCATTKQILDGIAADRDEVSVASVDVADALDLARAHNILRAPTTLLVSAEGHLLGRVSGIPRDGELEALLDGTREVSAA